MSTIADLRPGMIGFGPIDGPARWPVWAGQLILGEGFTVGDLKIEHVFVVTDVMTRGMTVVEAMPNGARGIAVYDRWTPEYAYVQLPEDYPGQGEDAAAIARAMIGTPYSFASYAALAAWRFDMLKGKQLPDGTIEPSKLEAWIDRREPAEALSGMHKSSPGMALGTLRVQLPHEAICSVLADQAWALTGKQVMPPGTPHQCVTPGALAGHLLTLQAASWLWPGRN